MFGRHEKCIGLKKKGGRPLRNPTYKCEDNIKMDNRRIMVIDAFSSGRGHLSLLRNFVSPESLLVSV